MIFYTQLLKTKLNLGQFIHLTTSQPLFLCIPLLINILFYQTKMKKKKVPQAALKTLGDDETQEVTGSLASEAAVVSQYYLPHIKIATTHCTERLFFA